MSEAELQGLARDLSPATRDLAQLTDNAIELLPQTDLVSKCARDVLLPTGDVVIRDEFETGRENYKDFFYAMAGLAGEGQNFDGNGMYVRFQTGGGSQRSRSATATPGSRRSSAACRRRRSATARPTRASCRRTSRTSPATASSCPTSTARPRARRRRSRRAGRRPARASRASSSRSAASCARSARGRAAK